MEWLIWIFGLVAVLAMAVSIGQVFMKEGLSAQEHRSPRPADAKRRRLSPSSWMI